MTRLQSAALTLVVAIGLAACVGEQRSAEEGESMPTPSGGPPALSGDTVTAASGLKYIVIKQGDGAVPQAGQTVSVHYTGWFTDGGKFDSSVDRGTPFSFALGRGNVIRGWDEGVAMMRVGGKRRLILPPQLAYGERGHPAGIPPNSTLIFDVELLGVE